MTETELVWRLRQLPRDIEPTSDLWPGIAARMHPSPARRPGRWIATFALAASVLLAGGLFWKSESQSPSVGPDVLKARIVAAESRAITDEYRAALRQLDGAPIAGAMAPTLHQLDQDVLQIRQALDADPDSVFLLQQLRRTYSTRLALTQRSLAT